MAVSTATIKKALGAAYAKNLALPAARRSVEKKLGLASGATIGFDSVYFALVGSEYPLPVGATDPKGKIAVAVRKRRDGKDGATLPAEPRYEGRSLRRWEAVAASATVALGRKVSVSDVRALYGSDEKIAKSYVGRGTKAGAPATRSTGAPSV